MSYQIGDLVTGTITGIQPYGGFIKLDEHTQGLIHISELRSGVIKDLNQELQIGDQVQVIILDIDQYTGKISLSLRQVGMMSLKNTPIIKNNSVKRHFWTNYHLNTGFEPIALALPGWIVEAKKRIS